MPSFKILLIVQDTERKLSVGGSELKQAFASSKEAHEYLEHLKAAPNLIAGIKRTQKLLRQALGAEFADEPRADLIASCLGELGASLSYLENRKEPFPCCDSPH